MVVVCVLFICLVHAFDCTCPYAHTFLGQSRTSGVFLYYSWCWYFEIRFLPLLEALHCGYADCSVSSMYLPSPPPNAKVIVTQSHAQSLKQVLLIWAQVLRFVEQALLFTEPFSQVLVLVFNSSSFLFFNEQKFQFLQKRTTYRCLRISMRSRFILSSVSANISKWCSLTSLQRYMQQTRNKIWWFYYVSFI